ncbi:Dabb family protein [Kibdelosporangium philippinense]|uniref:Dabb family protein n=1 Tax=Kibdelosporangium philippinense TaxID=211113 RepID=A0ABS8ZLL6_9PSEU|nr:Dabb family protein [Kibdelosporangium philippinense]MCE7008693.1 Dabb family protein [Kibdelosporangium philippinense]
MIVHMLRFSFKDGTSDADKEKVLALMRRTASMPSTLFGTAGQDLGDPAAGYTHAYCVGIEDLAALERYLYDPVNIDGEWQIFPHLGRLAGVRLSDDLDPGLSEKITAMARKKFEDYPELGALMATIPEVRL